jgi:hypothetical protein
MDVGQVREFRVSREFPAALGERLTIKDGDGKLAEVWETTDVRRPLTGKFSYWEVRRVQ